MLLDDHQQRADVILLLPTALRRILLKYYPERLNLTALTARKTSRLKQALLCRNALDMTDVEVMYEDFIASGRTGRRNALHDILGTTAGLDPNGLSQTLSELNISKAEENNDGEKSQNLGEAEPMEEEIKEGST